MHISMMFPNLRSHSGDTRCQEYFHLSKGRDLGFNSAAQRNGWIQANSHL